MKLAEFEGTWRLERAIANAMGPDAVFTGQAQFIPEATGLKLLEVGEMRLEGQPPMRAERVYHWQQSADGIEVFFDDGRFFHRIGPDARAQAHHDCAPDVYDVTYDFTHWPTWTAQWQVKGPRKDYRMDSRYSAL